MLRFNFSRILKSMTKNEISQKCASIISLVTLAIILSVGMISTSYAELVEDRSYITDSFVTEIQANEDYSFDVTETIDVDFITPKHGIFRYIPVSTGEYNVKDVKVIGDDYDVSTNYDSNKKSVEVKIGNKDRVLNGKMQYTIKYKIVGIKADKDSRDFLKLDLLPTEWNTPIGTAKSTLKMPKNVNWKDAEIFYGKYGSTSKVNDNKKFKVTSNDKQLTVEAMGLDAFEGVSMRSYLEPGYWVGAKNYDSSKAIISVLFILLATLTFILWWTFGRDPHFVRTIEFYSPDNMTPAEIGTFIDGKVENNDMTSMIVYFANKGYLKIEDVDKENFKFIKVKDIDQDEKPFAKVFFNGIFKEGDSVSTNSMPKDFGDKFTVAKDSLRGLYTGDNKIFSTASTVSKWIASVLLVPLTVAVVVLATAISGKTYYVLFSIPLILFTILGLAFCSIVVYGTNSLNKKQRSAYLFFGVLSLLASSFILAVLSIKVAHSNMLGLVSVLCFVISVIFITIMRARTKKSADLYGRIIGFREFIKTAELNKLEALVEDDPKYFFNVLPYAFVFGLSDKWIKNFEKIKVEQPDWYSSPNEFGMYNMFIYASMMGSMSKSFENTIVSQASSISSDVGSGGGFGGGGFSGGGFGGGGGGAW
ncbi:MAG: DUF2207 domain-containing protein [Peptostreptococcus sp.]|uniref:DUF2207 domain-containing protein n=1 Tax=Peptostreptococcus sp. TaxID=1262 RepID=UPI002FCB9075